MKNRRLQKNNASGVKGVCWSKKRKMWYAQIGHNGTKNNLGFHHTVEAAAAAYAEASKRLHGEFSRLA